MTIKDYRKMREEMPFDLKIETKEVATKGKFGDRMKCIELLHLDGRNFARTNNIFLQSKSIHLQLKTKPKMMCKKGKNKF